MRGGGQDNAEPFASAEEAWFWTVAALRARAQGVRGGGGSARRPCDPDDVLLCLDRLYRQGEIGPRHARVLRRWGRQYVSPLACRAGAEDAALWRETMAPLERVLVSKGVVRNVGKNA